MHSNPALKLFTCMTAIIRDVQVTIVLGEGRKVVAKPFVSELAVQQEALKRKIFGRLTDACCRKLTCARCAVPERVWGTFHAYTCQVVHGVATITHYAGGV